MKATSEIDEIDARMWGREAFLLGFTRAQAREHLAAHGCAQRRLLEMEAGYDRAHDEALHQEG